MDVENSEDSLLRFKEQIPVLGLLGVPHFVHSVNPFTIDDDVKCVCRYLKAFEAKTSGWYQATFPYITRAWLVLHSYCRGGGGSFL